MTEPNAGDLMDRQIAALALKYNRLRDLPIKDQLWDHQLEDFSRAGTAYIIAKLERAAAAEQRRGRLRQVGRWGMFSHWSYDMGHHVNLLVALRAEQIALDNCIEEAA